MQLVGDEDDRPAFGGHLAQGHEERLGFLRGEDRCRLVEDQDPRFLVERVQDLDALLLADGELPDPRTGIDGQRVTLAELSHLACDRVGVDQELAAFTAPVAEHDVLGDGESLDQPELLVHHADTGVEGVAGGGEADRLPVELDLAFVGPVETGEDVHQRRLAGAVFAEQGVHLPGGRLEINMVVGEHAREALRDLQHRNSRGGAATSDASRT